MGKLSAKAWLPHVPLPSCLRPEQSTDADSKEAERSQGVLYHCANGFDVDVRHGAVVLASMSIAWPSVGREQDDVFRVNVIPVHLEMFQPWRQVKRGSDEGITLSTEQSSLAPIVADSEV